MYSDELLKLKKLLDEGVITQEEFEQEKEKIFSDKNSKKGNKGLILGIICIVILCMSIMSSFFGDDDSAENVVNEQTKQESQIPQEFRDEFPVMVTGKMYDNIIGVPELSISINNNTNKNIAAIKIYFIPVDVYGQEVSGIFTTKELYTDSTILAGASVSKTWQMLDSSIKAGDVYIYSIYFEDGTEWGNKDASISDIQKYAYKFKVKY